MPAASGGFGVDKGRIGLPCFLREPLRTKEAPPFFPARQTEGWVSHSARRCSAPPSRTSADNRGRRSRVTVWDVVQSRPSRRNRPEAWSKCAYTPGHARRHTGGDTSCRRNNRVCPECRTLPTSKHCSTVAAVLRARCCGRDHILRIPRAHTTSDTAPPHRVRPGSTRVRPTEPYLPLGRQTQGAMGARRAAHHPLLPQNGNLHGPVVRRGLWQGAGAQIDLTDEATRNMAVSPYGKLLRERRLLT